MTYEQWTTMLRVVSSAAVIGFGVVGLMAYFMSKRRPDDRGRRRGRPWTALLAGAVSFFVIGVGGSAVFLDPYPEHQARYEREHEAAEIQVELEDDADRRENLAHCQLYCPDAPSRCGSLNVERCEERQRESRGCMQRCDDRYGRR